MSKFEKPLVPVYQIPARKEDAKEDKTTVSFWLTFSQKKKFERLQSITQRDFGRKLKEVVETFIENAPDPQSNEPEAS